MISSIFCVEWVILVVEGLKMVDGSVPVMACDGTVLMVALFQ